MKVKMILGIIIILIIGYLSILKIQNYLLSDSLNNYGVKDQNKDFKLVNYKTVRCNGNILKPEFAFVDYSITLGDIKENEIFFYNSKNIFSKDEDGENSYIGSTDIQNTTFENLLKMVKEDCYQFQKSKGYKVGNEKTEIYWTYGKHKAPKPKTKEEIEEDIKYKKEQEELLKKVESGEIIPKSTYDTLRESGLSDKAAKDVIRQMKEAGMKIYE